MRQTNLPGFSSYRPHEPRAVGPRCRSDELHGDKAIRSPAELKSAGIGESLASPKSALLEILR